MKTWQALLQEGDPVGREPGMSPDDVQRIRRVVLASEVPARPRDWTLHVAVAAGLSLSVGLGTWFGHDRIQPPLVQQTPAGLDRTAAPGLADPGRRQVQFATPGGTRIIWVFDANFHVR